MQRQKVLWELNRVLIWHDRVAILLPIVMTIPRNIIEHVIIVEIGCPSSELTNLICSVQLRSFPPRLGLAVRQLAVHGDFSLSKTTHMYSAHNCLKSLPILDLAWRHSLCCLVRVGGAI